MIDIRAWYFFWSDVIFHLAGFIIILNKKAQRER